MRRKLRRSTKQYIIVASISMLVMAGCFAILYLISTTNIKNIYGTRVKTLQTELYTKKQYVYEAEQDIEVGQLITEDLLKFHEVISEQSSNMFMKKEDLGKYALITIPKGSYIQKSMLLKDYMEDNLREVEIQVIKLSKNLIHNDFVDIRIFYPNGEDYVLLSKKALKVNEDIGQYLWLDEKEILLLSSAIVDAYLYESAYLYTTKYIEPSLQEASIVTYVPSLATINLIKLNPNIVEEAKEGLKENLRKEIENRQAENLKLEVEEVQWKVDSAREYNHKERSDSDNNYNDREHSGENKGDDYFYYTQEEEAKKEDVEYGE